MLIGGDNFIINSDFSIPTYGAALYHQSSYRIGNWQLTAGIRFDLEYSSMRYNSNATIPYMFDMTMSDYRDLYSEFKGKESQLFFEILPKIAAEYPNIRKSGQVELILASQDQDVSKALEFVNSNKGTFPVIAFGKMPQLPNMPQILIHD